MVLKSNKRIKIKETNLFHSEHASVYSWDFIAYILILGYYEGDLFS